MATRNLSTANAKFTGCRSGSSGGATQQQHHNGAFGSQPGRGVVRYRLMVVVVVMLVVVLVVMMPLPLVMVLVRSRTDFLRFAVSPTVHLRN